jgi:hypothetical protein
MDKYLIKYLVENAETPLSRKYIDFFKAELDWHIYVSETHMASQYLRNRDILLKEKLLRVYQYSYALLFQSKTTSSNNDKVLSTAYFPFKDTLSNLGIDAYSPIWHPVGKKNIFGDLKTLKWHKNIQDRIRNADFHSFLEPTFHQELETFQDHLFQQYQEQDFKGLLLYTDQYFYSKYHIEIFKKLDRPSFIFTHGMPGLYSLEVDNRTDYLMVWSDKIKDNYINAGFEASKIKVVGHPKYKNIAKEKELRSDLSDVLVIPISSVTWHQQSYDNIVVSDASTAVIYLYKVQKVLKRLGVKRARYRTHPSINKEWIIPFLDPNFYTIDTEPLSTSLDRSSLLIGSVSTVMFESLMHGVNYIAYDPKDENGFNMGCYKAVPPFDGSEEKLMLANDEDELEDLLKLNAKTDYSLVHDYIQDLDLSVMKKLI